jgi:hypothetical protein
MRSSWRSESPWKVPVGSTPCSSEITSLRARGERGEGKNVRGGSTGQRKAGGKSSRPCSSARCGAARPAAGRAAPRISDEAPQSKMERGRRGDWTRARHRAGGPKSGGVQGGRQSRFASGPLFAPLRARRRRALPPRAPTTRIIRMLSKMDAGLRGGSPGGRRPAGPAVFRFSRTSPGPTRLPVLRRGRVFGSHRRANSPELGADLVAALAGLDVDDLAPANGGRKGARGGEERANAVGPGRSTDSAK